ncbi:unnamed protein product [Arabis nemorensis]|uniref:Uncharacterized protein n=1 Tax=Arabis nemorensis TaxID=586526 RepID=A0A565BSV4_9BRAS|nr:unnamed protein product [Arabis nemorensis]
MAYGTNRDYTSIVIDGKTWYFWPNDPIPKPNPPPRVSAPPADDDGDARLDGTNRDYSAVNIEGRMWYFWSNDPLPKPYPPPADK